MNFLHMDFFRMRKNKSTYIIPIIWLVILIMDIVVYKVMTVMAGTNVLEATYGFGGGVFGYISSFIKMGSNMMLLNAIFILIFTNSEFSTGFIKNLVGKDDGRQLMMLSKSAVALFFNLIMLFETCIAGMVLYVVINGSFDVEDNFGKFIAVFFLQLILNTSFSTLMILVSNLLRNSAASMITGIVYISFSSIAYTLIDIVVNKVFYKDEVTISELLMAGGKFNIEDYIVSGNITGIGISSTNSDCIRAAVVAAVLYAICILAGTWRLTKTDLSI